MKIKLKIKKEFEEILDNNNKEILLIKEKIKRKNYNIFVIIRYFQNYRFNALL